MSRAKRSGARRPASRPRKTAGVLARLLAQRRRLVGAAVVALGFGVLLWAMVPENRRQEEKHASRPAAAAPPPAPVHIMPSLAPPMPAPARPAVEVTLRPPPAMPPPAPAKPAWLRFAVPAPPAEGRPQVAIVLDDLGLDRARTAQAIRLAGPVTLSFMTYAEDLARQTEAARRAGHELLLHVPMEPVDPRADPGPHALYTRLSRGEIVERLRWGLGRFDGYVGINNHMGSRFTADARGMAPVIEELRARGLAFLDSRTTAKSTGIRVAEADGVPHAARDVFLDDDQTPAAIAAQLARVEQVARHRGSAIAIGHAHDATLAALRAWLPTLTGKGLVLAPVSAVVRRRMAEQGGSARNASVAR